MKVIKVNGRLAIESTYLGNFEWFTLHGIISIAKDNWKYYHKVF